MDPLISWFQPEQQGPALDLFQRCWDNSQRQVDMNFANDSVTSPINTVSPCIRIQSQNPFQPAQRQSSTSSVYEKHDDCGTNEKADDDVFSPNGVTVAAKDMLGEPLVSLKIFNANSSKGASAALVPLDLIPLGNMAMKNEKQPLSDCISNGDPTSTANNKRKRENRACTYNFNQTRNELTQQYGGTPWKPMDKIY